MQVVKLLQKSANYKWTRSFSSSAGPLTIGFIGLGNMGSNMVNNLLKKDIQVVVHDISEGAVSKAVAAGAKKASNPADVASHTKHVITMLPSSPHVKDVYLGKDGILSGAQPGSLFIDSSTIDADVSREMEKQVLKKQCIFMDAPVSGGIMAAKEGTLTFMVGGSQPAFEETEAILGKMGKNIIYCGASGTGQAAKICNNMLLAISMIGTAEAMNLGQRLGMDAKLLAKILNMSSGQCWSSLKYNPCPGVLENVPSSNDYLGGFGTALMAKDLGLAQNAATATLSPTPLGSLAHQIYRMMCNSNLASKDFSSVYLFLQKLENKSS